MATIPYSAPMIFVPANLMPPDVRDIPAATGHTGTAIIKEGDLVVLASGTLARAATNANANIAGIALHGEQQVWNSDSTRPYDGNQVFGASQVGTLLPQEPGNVHLNPLTAIFLEISATTACSWGAGGTYALGLGSTGGLLLDATTNLYVFDPSQSNTIMRVYAKPDGPQKGGTGDLAPRVIVQFTSGVI